MLASVIIVREVKCQMMRVIFDFLRERICQSGISPVAHRDRQARAFDIAPCMFRLHDLWSLTYRTKMGILRLALGGGNETMSTFTKQQPPAPATPAPRVPPAAPIQINPQTILSQLKIADGRKQLAAIEKERGTRVLSLVYNESPPTPAGLGFPVIGPLEVVLQQMGRAEKLDLLLRTTGGLTEVPWRIISLLREFTDHLGVIVSKIAMSGGCHIAIAGDDLVMGPFSILGSVDPTRAHHLLPKDPNTNQPMPTSVQDLKHCMEFVKDQFKDQPEAERDFSVILTELFKHVHPLALGALEQSYSLARLITEKALRTRKTALSDDRIKEVVDRLAGRYFSHAFPISRSEVESDLGLPVVRPDAELSAAIEDYEKYYLNEFQRGVSIAPNMMRVGGLMETTGVGFAIVQITRPVATLVSDSWLKFR